jgi:hypothetical protein
MNNSNYSSLVLILICICLIHKILAIAIIGAQKDKKFHSVQKKDQSPSPGCDHIDQQDPASNLIVPSDYNKEVGPWEHNGSNDASLPLTYHYEFLIFDIQEVNDLKQTVHLNMYFILIWSDFRININQTWYHLRTTEHVGGGFAPISLRNLDNFWIPDVEIYRLNKYQSQSVLKPSASLRINKEGVLKYISQVSVTTNCDMDFSKFPFDSQRCNFRVGSFSSHAKVVNCTSKFGFDTNENQRALQYTTNIVELPVRYRTYRSSGVEWPNCGFSIELERTITQILLQVYVTSTLLVIISWLSFVVNPSCIPGRMGMLITVFLVLINIFIGLKNSSPTSNGLNAADVFVVACIVEVFAALLEYAMVLVIYEPREEAITSVGNSIQNQVPTVTPIEGTEENIPPPPLLLKKILKGF